MDPALLSLGLQGSDEQVTFRLQSLGQSILPPQTPPCHSLFVHVVLSR